MKHLLLEIAGVNSEKEFYDKYKSKNDFLSVFPEAADLLNNLPQAKNGGTLLPKTITCSNCGWSWKAADGGNDVGTCHKCGNENKIMKYGGLTKYQSAGQVTYGTPEYRDAYNRGEVITDEGVRSPILLDEVTVQNNYKRPRGFWEQSRDKYLKDNRDAGFFGAIGSVATYPLSVGQHALTYGIEGKVQDPSEAWGNNPGEGWFDSLGAFGRNLDDAALNIFLDPANLIGAGILTKEKALSRLGKMSTSIAPELRQGLRTAGPSFGSSYPSFKEIINNPENIDAEHLAKLIKRESDWLRDPEYIRRKRAATGRSEASIKKESENIIDHINNTSINYTGTAEDAVSGLYSPGTNPKIQIFDGSPDYYGAGHSFYTGVLDHEVKHAFSETAVPGDPLIDYITGKGYKNYPKANLNKNLSDKISSAFGMNWANLAPEQQVTGRRMMDLIENTQGVKRGTELTDSNIEGLITSLKNDKFDNADMYEVALAFKNKFGDNYQKHLKDFLNKAWVKVPAAVGLGTVFQTGEKKRGGLIKAQEGYQTGNEVVYGTPEYEEAYNRGEVITEDGQRSPILLDEVVIQNNYKKPRGFWEQYRDKILDENRDAGPLGAAVGVPISAAFSVPQLAIVKGINNLPTLFGQQPWNDGKMQRPAEAMGIENPFGAFATDLFLDPANLIGAGILTKEKALAKLGAIKESGLMSKFFPEKNYTLPEVPAELNLDVNSSVLNLQRPPRAPRKRKLPEWHELDLGNGLIEQTPLRKGLNDNVVKRIKINDKGSITLRHYKDANGKTVYFFNADVAEGGLNAGKAYKQLEKFIPKGSKILEQKSLSTDSFYNVLRRAQNPKQFTWVDEGMYIPLNSSGVNRAFSNADKAFPNSMDLKFENFNEAKKALNELNARITIEGMPKAKLSKIVDDVQLIENGPWVKQTRFGIDIPNIGLIKQYQRAGTVKPIYVQSKNDPRYKAYNDSLLLYKLSERQRLKGTNNKENILFNKKGSKLQEIAKDLGYLDIKEGHFFPNSKVAIQVQGEDDRKKPNSLENDYNNDEYVHPNIAPVKGYNWSTETGLKRLLESNDNFLYKKPQQQVIVKYKNAPQYKTIHTGEGEGRFELIKIQAIQNNLRPAGLVYGDTDLYSDLPTIRPTARNAKSYKVRETTQGIYGPSTVDYDVTDPRNINMNDLGPGNTREITPRYQVGGRSEEDLVQGQPLDEVVVYGKPTEFGALRNNIKKQNSWEQFANDRFLGNFERNMGQTINNLSDSRKQEYEDYINKLTFDEYVKTHPMLRGEKRGEYIDRIQRTNANSPNFQRAYEANAEYNPSTDVNNWRKGLMGLGSVLLGPDNINKLKQSSRYFSSKEKSDMLQNPISAAAETTLGTFAPLEIPANMAYGENNNWSDALSGRGTYVPMSGRLLADPTILAFEAVPLISKGLSAIGRSLGAEEGLLTNFHNAPHLQPADDVSNNIRHMQKLKENNYVFQNKVKPEANAFDQPLSAVNKTNEGSPYATQFDPEEMDPLLDFMYQEKDINDIKNSIKAEVVRYPVTKRLFTDPDPKRVDQFYSVWADKLHPSLSLEVTPSEMQRVHQEALDYFGNSRQIFDKDLGAYMTSRLRNKIPAYNEPVVRDASGARQMFAKDQRSATTFDRWYPERTNTDYIPSFSFAEMGPENLHATDLYTRGYDATINSLFRNNNFAPSKVNMYNEIAENLQNAILKNKISKPTSVRRGIVDDYELELLNPESFQPTGVRKFRSQLAEGDVFKDDAFMSTSRDLRHDWGEQSLAEKINIPGGNVQSYFHPDSGSFSHFNVTENEFLLPKGLVRRVKRTLDPAIENAGFETEILNPYKKGGYPHLFW